MSGYRHLVMTDEGLDGLGCRCTVVTSTTDSKMSYHVGSLCMVKVAKSEPVKCREEGREEGREEEGGKGPKGRIMVAGLLYVICLRARSPALSSRKYLLLECCICPLKPTNTMI